ncbi:MAG TPA: alpha/beta hydrolase [Polyangiales bacterium]|nr:alpha/beta hydrolase [Polyangiales bacterium]
MDSLKGVITSPLGGPLKKARTAVHAANDRARLVRKQRGDATPRNLGGKGEPLVLLHPFALCSEVWQPILPLLERHHEVFSLPIPGHAGSDPLPQNYRFTIEEAVDLLEAKLDQLGIRKAHLVGNSLGGWLAIELARRGRALSVVSLAPGGGWEAGSKHLNRLLRRFQMTQFLLSFGGPVAMKLARWTLPRRYFLRDAVANPERLTPLEARLLIESTWRCAVYGDVVKAIPTQPLSEPFAKLPCPVRLVWGAKDRLLPLRGYSERWRRVLPGADWVVLPEVGHVQMYDDPHAVARSILDFTRRAREWSSADAHQLDEALIAS